MSRPPATSNARLGIDIVSLDSSTTNNKQQQHINDDEIMQPDRRRLVYCIFEVSRRRPAQIAYASYIGCTWPGATR